MSKNACRHDAFLVLMSALKSPLLSGTALENLVCNRHFSPKDFAEDTNKKQTRKTKCFPGLSVRIKVGI